MKIQSNGVDYYPPTPFVNSGKIEFKDDGFNGFKSTFFNTATGAVAFGDNNSNYFKVLDVAISLAEYYGENGPAVRQFDNMITYFYFGFQPVDQFYFDYQEVFSGRILIVTNPLGNKIFYSNLLLANNKVSLNKEIALYPNPAKSQFFIKSPNKNLGKVNVEIFDSSGRIVSSQSIFSADAVNTKVLSNGIYRVKVRGVGVESSSKLLIQK